MTCNKSKSHSPVRKSRKKCKKSQFRSRSTGYCRKKKCGSGRTRDIVTRLCRNKKTRKSHSRKSSTRKSPKRKSRSRKSSLRKSRSRKSSCPTGMIRNKSNGRCRVKCVLGKTTRSRSTGRCRKIKSITRTRKSSTRKSRSHKSSPMKRLPKCTKERQTRSRSSGRCRVPPCPIGMIRNKSNGKCRVKCQPGRIRGPSGRCIKRPKKSADSSVLDDSTRGADGHLNLDDKIQIWADSGHMFPNSSGFTPPPSSNNRAFASVDIPSWSSIPNIRDDHFTRDAQHPSVKERAEMWDKGQAHPWFSPMMRRRMRRPRR